MGLLLGLCLLTVNYGVNYEAQTMQRRSDKHEQSKGITMTRESFYKVYLDWVNNYLTIEKFAEHYGLHINEAESLINLSKTIFENNHPES